MATFGSHPNPLTEGEGIRSKAPSSRRTPKLFSKPLCFFLKPRRLALPNQSLVFRQIFAGVGKLRSRVLGSAFLLMAIRIRDQNVEVQRPEPQLTHARFSCANELIRRRAHPLRFFQFVATCAHESQTTPTGITHVEQAGDFALIKVLLRHLKGCVEQTASFRRIAACACSLLGQQLSVIPEHERVDALFTDRFRQRDALNIFTLGALPVTEEPSADSGDEMRP